VGAGTTLLMITVSKPVIVGRSRARVFIFHPRGDAGGRVCRCRW